MTAPRAEKWVQREMDYRRGIQRFLRQWKLRPIPGIPLNEDELLKCLKNLKCSSRKQVFAFDMLLDRFIELLARIEREEG